MFRYPLQRGEAIFHSGGKFLFRRESVNDRYDNAITLQCQLTAEGAVAVETAHDMTSTV
jgi:hypothetical protein